MGSLSVFLVAAALVVQAFNVQAQNMKYGQLRNLFNQNVHSVQKHVRPLDIWGGRTLQKIGIQHSGVVATMGDGSRYLVHKGAGFGNWGQTIATNANHMSSRWKPSGSSRGVHPGTNLGSLIRSGGRNYNVLCSNCNHASRRIMNRNSRRP